MTCKQVCDLPRHLQLLATAKLHVEGSIPRDGEQEGSDQRAGKRHGAHFYGGMSRANRRHQGRLHWL